ncbi:aminotransferase class I/II-fold pyridoxal phosphate-dependent enzyme [Neisseria sp. Ec49-e6-T10]|uniref:aminotransferase class I/II-fold pyridoxal phosphate-dependent enzyme n=1 Tax=Neisseria sp. Ec49-e6-T10 TaxID=3140744 RepID=UPI003EBE0D32
MIHGHGDDGYRYGRPISINFSSNVYGRFDWGALHQHLSQSLALIHSYPEPAAESLVALLAQKECISPESICVTNGATEAIYLIAQAFAGKKSSIIIPTFSEYADACVLHQHQMKYAFSLHEAVSEQTDLLWLCHPNNPTGLAYDQDELEHAIKRHPNTLFVIDQSYEHFTQHPLFSVSGALTYPNVMVLHSMTKHYAIPGLRLGYMTASADLLRKVTCYCMPWAVNQLAIEAGKYLLNHHHDYTIDLDTLLIETKQLQKQLETIEGITVYPTDTHFFLVCLAKYKAAHLKNYLANEFGFLIRDAANFAGLNEYYLRIATQNKHENNQLIQAIKQWQSSHS